MEMFIKKFEKNKKLFGFNGYFAYNSELDKKRHLFEVLSFARSVSDDVSPSESDFVLLGNQWRNTIYQGCFLTMSVSTACRQYRPKK